MKHADIIQTLDLEQKCALLSGGTVFDTRALPGKGIPSITLSDGPNGVRKQALREASKNILYTVVNSRAYAAENLNPGMAKWEIIMIGADVLVALLIVALEIKTFKSYKKRKEEEEENA